MPTPLRVLIVGGGIAGLALGRALRERGFAPEIIERAASWPTTGAGLYLPGNGVRALRALGLADKLLAKAVHIRRQRILDHAGRHLADVDLTKVWSPVCTDAAFNWMADGLDPVARVPALWRRLGQAAVRDLIDLPERRSQPGMI